MSITETDYIESKPGLKYQQKRAMQIINQYSQSSSPSCCEFQHCFQEKCEDITSQKFEKILIDIDRQSNTHTIQENDRVSKGQVMMGQKIKQNNLKGLIREKDFMIYKLTEQLIDMKRNLDRERDKSSNLEQYIEKLQSIYSRDSEVRRQNLSQLQIIERNQDILIQKLDRISRLNKKYEKQIDGLRQNIKNLTAAIHWSEQENYRFRITLRELKQKLNLAQNVKDGTFLNKSLNKSHSCSITEESYSVQELTKHQWRSKLEISTLGKKLFDIAEVLPLQSSQTLALFEPENDQDLQTIVNTIEEFCKDYDNKMKNLEYQRKQQQKYMGQLLCALGKKLEIPSGTINQYMQTLGKGKTVIQNINFYYKQCLNA